MSIIKSISIFAPFFILFYAWFLKNRFPTLFKEETDKPSVTKKVALFTLMIAGVILMKD